MRAERLPLTRLTAMVFPKAAVIEAVALRGGLEGSVTRLTIRDPGCRQRHVVVKRVTSGGGREASRHELLGRAGLAPVLLGTVTERDGTYLFLEHVRSVRGWPWRDSRNTQLVLRQLAEVHAMGDSPARRDGWDYETELAASAAETVACAGDLAMVRPDLGVQGELRALQRVALAITPARAVMRAALGTTLIHGDVHTRNVALRRVSGVCEAILLDWGRSRAGSPLEDVSSWLLSLRGWEPAAAREHDTLLRSYLAASGRPTHLTSELRTAYWIAAAGNALAGALRHHLRIAGETRGRTHSRSMVQVRAALRAIRRADERLRSA